MLEENRLSPEGARLLRAARDQIVADPDSFAMEFWDCGTQCCIGGHMGRLAGLTWKTFPMDSLRAGLHLSVRCGFGIHHPSSPDHPFYRLLYWWPQGCERDVRHAVCRINDFLWSYGFPPEDAIGASPVVEVIGCVEG